MPLLPPVMTATFPSSFFMIFLLLLVAFKFARVERDTFAMISEVEHHAGDV